MKKFPFFALLLSLVTMACNKTANQSDKPKMTMEDSLLQVMEEQFGDTTFMVTFLDGGKGYHYDMLGSLPLNVAASQKISNAFDRILRVERTVSKELYIDSNYPFKPDVNTTESTYKWESFDYSVYLCFALSEHYRLDGRDSISEVGHVTFEFTKK